MTKTHAASATSLKRALVLALGVMGMTAQPALADWDKPWQNEDRAIVIDAYEFNPIDWNDMAADERITGFINKASDGLPPKYGCGSKRDDEWLICTNRWWRYSVTKELYMTRRQMADSMDLLWGAYHLARPGNPREQADHFLEFAEPREDDLIALDIEDLSDEFMSLDDAEIFSKRIKERTGRYPVLYTNGNTAQHIADNRADYPLLSRLPIWYARYTNDIDGKFPAENWPAYALWQFSSMHNCNANSCPYRVGGTKDDIDVNVSHLDADGLRAAWPFNELFHAPEPEPKADPSMLIASLDDEEAEGVAKTAASHNEVAETADGLLAAYGESDTNPKRVDPLKLLKNVASKAQEKPESRVKAQLQDAETTAAVIEGEDAPGMPVPKPNPLRAEADADGETEIVTEAEPVVAETEEEAALDAGTGALIDGARTFFGPAMPESASGTDSAIDDGSDAAEQEASAETDEDGTNVAVLSHADMRIDAAFSLSN